MKKIVSKHIHSFSYAYAGMMWAFREHQNYRIHAFVSLVAVLCGEAFHISPIEWMILLLTIVLGFVIETVNTAIEATLDAVDVNWREDIRIAKDVAAGAMLIYSIGALTIAAILFIPKILY
ncbi:MAG: diacylglycerol kinase family protein [Candidatus Roizmanbacteria bacterium]